MLVDFSFLIQRMRVFGIEPLKVSRFSPGFADFATAFLGARRFSFARPILFDPKLGSGFLGASARFRGQKSGGICRGRFGDFPDPKRGWQGRCGWPPRMSSPRFVIYIYIYISAFLELVPLLFSTHQAKEIYMFCWGPFFSSQDVSGTCTPSRYPLVLGICFARFLFAATPTNILLVKTNGTILG